MSGKKSKKSSVGLRKVSAIQFLIDQYFQRFRKFEVEFNAYIAKHDMHDLFINLMSECFEKNIENPREFISKNLSTSVNESAEDEILQLKDDMKKLSNESINLKLKIACLEKRLSVEQKRANHEGEKRQHYSSSDESLDDKPHSKRVTTRTGQYSDQWNNKAVLLSPSSDSSSFHPSCSEIYSSNTVSETISTETSKGMSSSSCQSLSSSTDDARAE